MEKPNRDTLRKLMGMHDVSAKVVAELLEVSPEYVHQWRGRTWGADISNARLFYLKHLLELRDQQNQE